MFDIFKKPKTFFTSDLHFYHKNVINYCNRPFKDVEEMAEHIIKVWNDTVKPKDKIYVLGDFSLNPKWSKILVPKLNGYKTLVAGNHDACHISNKKSEKFVEKYLEEWDDVYKSHTQLTLKDGTFVNLCHLPYDNQYDTRYSEYKLDNKGTTLLHGHVHGRYIKNGNQIDVGWDAHQKIISEDEIIEIIKDKREFIPSHLSEFYKNRPKDSKESAD